jgi:hypothetical protein
MTSLTGQALGGDFVTKLRTIAQNAKTKAKEIRPGVFIPVERSSLVSPGSVALDHPRVVPQKNYRSGMSLDY